MMKNQIADFEHEGGFALLSRGEDLDDGGEGAAHGEG